jgi:hypothetical protein
LPDIGALPSYVFRFLIGFFLFQSAKHGLDLSAYCALSICSLRLPVGLCNLKFIQCRNRDSDVGEHACNRHPTVVLDIIFNNNTVLIQFSAFDKLCFFHIYLNSNLDNHKPGAADSAIHGPSDAGQSYALSYT